jgi:hypothetical protein
MPAPRSNPATTEIQPPANATPAASDEEKGAAAEAEAAAAAEAVANADSLRFVQYVVAVRAAAKLVTRPSGADTAGPNAASRIGVGAAIAQFSVQDWAKAGITTTEPTVWNFDNNWAVAADKFSAAQLEFLLVEDRRWNGIRFELVDGNGNKVDS